MAKPTLQEIAGCAFVAAMFLAAMWAIIFPMVVMTSTAMYSRGVLLREPIPTLVIAFAPLAIVLGGRP
jgi:hypothetical protein